MMPPTEPQASRKLPPFTNQVRRNCDISDAQFAGNFSICGLALRLRDLYKWEHELPPWVEHPSDQVLALLGHPENIRVGMMFTYWYYSDRGTAGPHVYFNTKGMTVVAWRQP